MNAREIMRGLARNNAWANHRLHKACAQLSTGSLQMQRTSYFPTILLTLNHILLVDWYYVDALVKGGRGRTIFSGDDERFRSLAPLTQAQREVDRKLIEHVESASLEEDVHIERRDHVQVESASLVLLHLFEHQIHHRGQVHAMLAGTTVAPPQLDEFFLKDELPLRKQDLLELGLPLE
jgi:uncharacterized damage-inducible protein DinB